MITRPAQIAMLAALLAMILCSIAGLVLIPADASVPVHFDASGTPDRYGSRAEALFALPVVSIFVFGVAILAARLDPRARNIASSRLALSWSLGTLAIFMLLLHGAMIAYAAGYKVNIAATASVGIGLLFMVIGNFLTKTRSNFTIGIRTPWTLSSEHSWRLTHLWGGRAFVLVGAATLLAALFGGAAALAILIAGSLLMLPALFYMSWHFWKQDPERSA